MKNKPRPEWLAFLVVIQRSWRTLLAVACSLWLTTAWATWNAETTGSVEWVGMYAPDAAGAQAVLFRLSNQPTTGCAANDAFSLSPASISDPQTLKNMVALVLAAKASGQPILVAHDSGAACDATTSRPRVYFVQWRE
jgi:hypothetical protein